jgi:predicted GNAT family acetyltransferase
MTRTGAILEPDPFYAAKFTSCNRGTLTPPRNPLPFGDHMRLATTSDAARAAVLCKEFADDSVIFPLSLADAQREADEMIRNQQLWVYYTVFPDGIERMASIVACTRTTNGVAAINKVYTAEDCRRRGCAEQLVRRVCD